MELAIVLTWICTDFESLLLLHVIHRC